PFGVFNELPPIKIQCQLLRHLLLIETKNVSEDMFIVKINSTVLRFEVKKFAAVTGLKCRLLSDFVLDPSIPNRLIQKYFGKMNKVPKLDFLNKFKEPKFFEPEDRFKIGVLYFISTLLIGSEASKQLYLHCILIWFRSVSMSTTHGVWFYECCHSFDNTVAIRVANGTPRIFNWKRSNEIIFFEDLMNIIFRTYDNQHKFKNIVLTAEEMNTIDQNNLHESSSHHETENQAT
ncbi:hypothetical protein H5410_005298, partial [Solanum commersonii]